jgi:iron(III) transport system ATP-binding protein
MFVNVDDVEYGGLHLDVMLSVAVEGSPRRQLHARVATFDSFRAPRLIERDARMVLAFDPIDGRTFDTDGRALPMDQQALVSALVG